MPEDEKEKVGEKDSILNNDVRKCNNENENPKKCNIVDPRKGNFEQAQDILSELNINVDDYNEALSISNDNDFQVHLKQQAIECFIYNFVEGLQVWKAEMKVKHLKQGSRLQEKHLPQECLILKKWGQLQWLFYQKEIFSSKDCISGNSRILVPENIPKGYFSEQ